MYRYDYRDGRHMMVYKDAVVFYLNAYNEYSGPLPASEQDELFKVWNS